MSRGTIGIVGPLLGEHAGWVESPGLALAERLGADGWTVRTTSRSPGRLRRAADVGSVAWRWRGQVDVVVVMAFSGRALSLSRLGLRAATAAGARPVAWLHGGGLPEMAASRPGPVDAVLHAGPVVAPSAWLASWAERRGAAARVIPNVLEAPAPFRRRSPLRPRLLWMRTYHDLYDPLLAVDAFAHLHAERPDATMTMAGQDRGLRSVVRAEVAARGLDGAVAVHGFFDREAKARAFADHDVFLSTNRVDNAPVTVVEAGAAGLAVVALAVGGVPTLLEEGRGGVLVSERRPAALAAAVAALLDDPERAGRLSDAGRRRAEAHRWEAVGPAWQRLLAEVADA